MVKPGVFLYQHHTLLPVAVGVVGISLTMTMNILQRSRAAPEITICAR